MPRLLAARQVPDRVAISDSALLEFDLHELPVPFGHDDLDVALDRVIRHGVERPVAANGGRVGVDAGRERCCQDLVARPASGERDRKSRAVSAVIGRGAGLGIDVSR